MANRNGSAISEKRHTSLPWRSSSLVVVITACITWTFASMIYSLPKSCEQCGAEIGYTVPHRLSTSKTDNKRKEQAVAAISEPYTGPSRVFPKFEHPFPCFKGEPLLMRETPAAEGILFQRPHKTGSTTMVGIVLRLAHNRAKDKPFNTTCKHRAIHGTARHYRYQERDRTKSFLFSIIRDPTTRVISEFFHFDVTAYEKEPTDSNFLGMVRQKGHNYYLKQLTTRQYVNGTIVPELDFAKSKGYKTLAEFYGSRSNREQLANMEFGLNYSPTRIVQEILDDYNFIAIMERMDESLVVFQMLLGLTTKEIIYTRARSSGTFSNGWHGRPCFFIMKAFLTPGMKQFFASEEYKAIVANDLLMYQAANKSLDLTIASLDPVEFKKNMAALQLGLKLAANNCKDRIRTLCDEGGTPISPKNTTCYIWAEGCDHDCVDELNL